MHLYMDLFYHLTFIYINERSKSCEFNKNAKISLKFYNSGSKSAIYISEKNEKAKN